tara:strand:+ start:763 stop:1017 length:255 start_codon:yes stop_codon:yes gene_type:complete
MRVKYRHVSIKWLDAQSSTEWKPLEESDNQKLALCISTGYVINESEESISIASDFASSDRLEIDSFGNVITIPLACIVKITTLD